MQFSRYGAFSNNPYTQFSIYNFQVMVQLKFFTLSVHGFYIVATRLLIMSHGSRNLKLKTRIYIIFALLPIDRHYLVQLHNQNTELSLY